MTNAPHRLRWLSALLRLRRTDRVLEIGCGNGMLLELLAERAPHTTLVGIDRSGLQVRKATQRLAALPNPPRVHHLALEDATAQFVDETFTRIVSMNVSLAWTSPAIAGAALNALLAPRGVIILGFEPPTRNGRAALLDKVVRAATVAGFAHGVVHEDDASGAFAVEWRRQPRELQ